MLEHIKDETKLLSDEKPTNASLPMDDLYEFGQIIDTTEQNVI